MKLVKKIRLVYREGKSDKVYEVDLVELPGTDGAYPACAAATATNAS